MKVNMRGRHVIVRNFEINYTLECNVCLYKLPFYYKVHLKTTC